MTRNCLNIKYLTLLIITALIVIVFQPVFGLNTCSGNQEYSENDNTEHFFTIEKCYGLVIPLVCGENLPYTSIQQSITNMINDLLRLNISVFWVASNFSSLSGKIIDTTSVVRSFNRGAFLIPFTNKNYTDALIISIAHDYESGSEIESYLPVDIYYILQPISVRVHPLNYPKAAYHFGVNIAHWCLLQYLKILNSGGFFDNELLFDDEIKEKLNNEKFNIFIWSAARGGNIKSTIESSVNPDICKSVSDFINNGGGFVGSCYGAYAASSGPILPMKFLQSYGYLSLTSSSVTPLVKCVAYITTQIQNMSHPVSYGLEKIQDSFLWEGPVFSQRFMNSNSQSLAMLNSIDIAFWTSQKEPSPWFEEKFIDFFVDKPIWVSSQFGKGRVVVFGDHPEFHLPSRNDRLIHNAIFYTTAENKITINLNHSLVFSEIVTWCSHTDNLTLPEYSPLFCSIWNMTNALNVTCKNIDDLSKKVFIQTGKISIKNKDDHLLKRSLFYQDSYQPWIEKFSKALKKLETVYTRTKHIESITANVSIWNNQTTEKLHKYYNDSLVVFDTFKILNEKVESFVGSSIEKIQITALFDTLDANYRKCYNGLIQLWAPTIKLYRNSWYLYELEQLVHGPVVQQLTILSFLQKKGSFNTAHSTLKIIYVDDDAHLGGNGSITHPYNHIQDAIDASIDGDRVFVQDGIYHEHLFIGKRIEVIGANKNTTIIDGGKTPYHMIWVSKSNVKICNFTIQNSSSNQYSCGIVLYSSHNLIEGNIFKNNCIGLGFAPRSCNNVIKNNIFLHNIFMGLGLDESSQQNTTITGNIFINNSQYGLYTVNNYNIIRDNIFINDGLTIEVSSTSLLPDIMNNTVNNKPIICFKNVKNFHIKNAGEIILFNCSNGTIDNIHLMNTDTGIYVFNSSDVHIINCTISHNLVGITLQSSTDIDILHNIILNNSWCGVWLSESDDNKILNNSLSGNNDGIYLFSSTSNNIKNNNITQNIVGFSSWSSSENNIISQNNFINNHENAFDKCQNQWNNNYWNDWIGLYNNVLNFLPYYIHGRVILNCDRYPAQGLYNIP